MTTHDLIITAFDEWYPQEYVDEILPEKRETPGAWVERYADTWRIAPTGLYPNNDDGLPLVDGQTVPFTACRRLGTGTLTIAKDWSWSLDREKPARTNNIWLHEIDHYGDDLADIVNRIRDSGDLGPGKYALNYSQWEDFSFRFDAATGTLSRITKATLDG